MNTIIEIFKILDIYDYEFFDYIKDKIKVYDIDNELGLWGCFIKLDKNIIKDIKILVPKIKDNNTLLINIHEFYHAYSLYKHINKKYIDDVDKYENDAINIEKSVVKKLNIKTNNCHIR